MEALIGAALGALFTIAVGLLAQWRADRSEHDKWLRDRQLEACVELYANMPLGKLTLEEQLATVRRLDHACVAVQMVAPKALAEAAMSVLTSAISHYQAPDDKGLIDHDLTMRAAFVAAARANFGASGEPIFDVAAAKPL